MLLAAAVGIAVQAVQEIRTPHLSPAPWTLAVLVGVVIVKAAVARRVRAIGAAIGGFAVDADARHHLSDASPRPRRSSGSPSAWWAAGVGIR